MDILIIAWQCLQIYGLDLILVGVHEAGHQITGALLGYRWKYWIVGPLKVSRETGRVCVSYSKMWFGGRAGAFRHPLDTRLRRSCRIIGGPLANLLLGMGLFFYLRYFPPVRHSLDWTLMAMLVISFLIVLESVIPSNHNGVKNDAMLLVQLWKDREKWADYYAHRDERNCNYEAEMDRHKALAILVGSMKAGHRPRDWDDNMVARVIAFSDGKPGEALASHYAFYWAADRGDWEIAGEYIGRALALRELVSDTSRSMFLLDSAFYNGLIRADGDAAMMHIAEAMSITVSNTLHKAMIASMTLRAEAAVLLADGKSTEAAQKAQEALSSLSFAGAGGCADRCLIECLIAACSGQKVQTI
jgi:hypothetical protein